MKKTIIKFSVFVLVFLISLVVISKVMNQGNENLTMEMASATLPVVTMETADIAYNQLHGYRSIMDTAYQRETVTELGEKREVSFQVTPYGLTIQGIMIEVRSLSGDRLVENSSVKDISIADREGNMKCTVALKDLIQKDTEYMLVILLDTEEEGTIRYYTRIMWSENTYAQEKLSFVKYFHNILYDREAAREQGITKYLESNATGDNTTFHKVNIHSSFHQITWGDLNVTEETEPVIQMTELGTQTANFVLHYYVSTEEEKVKTYYQVKEAYRVRFLTNAERLYLLDFERTMTQIPDVKGDIYSNDKILLGIVDENLPLVESVDGNLILFQVAGRLCSYNVTTGKMTILFSFYDKKNGDARTLYDQHAMKILDVDEGGNVHFSVYGYMNRGRHEGEVGIAVYHYDNTLNTIEELVYIPTDKSFQVLKQELEQLFFLNREDELYLYFDQTVFCIDTSERSSQEMVTITRDNSMMTSEDHRVLVWQEGSDIYHCTGLEVRNLSSGLGSKILAEEGTAIKLLGFMGTDIIYGLARLEDITEDVAGNTFFPMYKIGIRNSEGELLKETGQDNMYVIGCTVTDGQITLDRMLRMENGSFESTTQDYIMTNEESAAAKNKLVVVGTQVYEKYVQIQTRHSIDAKKLQVRSPKEVVFEGGRELVLALTNSVERYYTYDMVGAAGIYTEPAGAIMLAYDKYGVVTLDTGEKIWERGNLVTRNQIMAIKEARVDENRDSLAVCLDTILQKEGIIRNTRMLLDEGKSVKEILSEGLIGARVLELTGVPMDAVLYYVNQDIPVLAMVENGKAVLITGFNELNVVIMNPSTGQLGKVGKKDSAKWFEENGNSFMTYVYK